MRISFIDFKSDLRWEDFEIFLISFSIISCSIFNLLEIFENNVFC